MQSADVQGYAHINTTMSKEDDSNEDLHQASVVDTLIENAATAVAIAELDEFQTDEFQEEIRAKAPPKPRRAIRKRDRCKEQTVNCLKKSCLYMLSYVGLTCLVVAYSILGGIIFPALEAPHEKAIQSKVLELRANYTYKIERELYMVLRMHVHYNTTRNYTGFAEKLLREFQKETYDFINTDGWSGVDDELGGEDKWSFAGGLLYAVTVITTIGYGFNAPTTPYGQGVTMVYALVGIPLTFLCLSNIGGVMASLFRALYGRTLCVECRRYGFNAPKTPYGQGVTMVYALVGIPLTFLCLSNIGGVMASLFRALYGRTLCVECRRTFFLSVMTRRDSDATADKIELDNLENNQEAIEYTMATAEHTHQKDVPILVCLILVVWYVAFGAVLFMIWEKDWTLFTGAYFCFITLSTIGFGDIVPGFSRQEWDDQVKQVACSLYLLIGLSTLAMVFDLMQQQGRVLAARFGTFIGLVKKQ